MTALLVSGINMSGHENLALICTAIHGKVDFNTVPLLDAPLYVQQFAVGTVQMICPYLQEFWDLQHQYKAPWKVTWKILTWDILHEMSNILACNEYQIYLKYIMSIN